MRFHVGHATGLWLLSQFLVSPCDRYVFGKIRATDGTYQSCCVAVPNVERHLHFLPRAHKRSDRTAAVEMSDVWQEVKDLFSKRFPNEASAFKSRTVKRKASGIFLVAVRPVPAKKRPAKLVL